MKKVTVIKKRRRLYNKNTDAFVFVKGILTTEKEQFAARFQRVRRYRRDSPISA